MEIKNIIATFNNRKQPLLHFQCTAKNDDMSQNKNPDHEIFQKMAALCSRSEQCVSDIRKRIKSLEGNEEAEERIIEKLKEENFLNEERYSRAFANEKFRIYRWGRVKIGYHLKMNGISSQDIKTGLEVIDQDEYAAVLIKTMKDKAAGLKKAEHYKKMAQVIRFAQGRGFEPEMIHRYLQEALI